MDKRLQYILRLYGETPEGRTGLTGPSVSANGVAGDGVANDDLVREERSLSDARYIMERRERTRPSGESIDRIVAHAAAQRRGPDKPAAQIFSFASARWTIGVAAVVAFVALAIGYFRLIPESGVLDPASIPVAQAPGQPAAEVVRDAASAPVGSVAGREVGAPVDKPADVRLADADSRFSRTERLESAAPHDVAADFSAGESVAWLPEDASEVVENALAWDTPSSLMLLQRRIDMLRATGQDLDWGEPVPLEQLPASATRPGIQAAGAGNQRP